MGKIQRKDALYVANLFDLMKWWREYGSVEFKHMRVAAAVLLGKPTHNGFQERVFSRGTYADCRLKKKLKADNFEMKVLNSLNVSEITYIQQMIAIKKSSNRNTMVENLQAFFKNSNTTEIMTLNDFVSSDSDDDI